MSDAPTPYAALPLQVNCPAINRCVDREEAAERMDTTLTHVASLIRGAKAFARTFTGDEVRLVVLPEYFLTSFPMGEAPDEWREKAAIEPHGPEYERLSRIASDTGVYLSGNVYETDANFPTLYFQVSFIIDDAGEVVLRYRRLVSMFAPTPHDVLDRYLDLYGADALFPVADTPLGRLACVASEEILYPEITRALAVRGAEVICHSSSEIGSGLATPKNIAKQARAYENMVYVVSANSGGISGIPFPEHSTDGGSQVVDYKGRVVAEALQGESMAGMAEVDIAGLRRTRAKPAMTNLLARQRLDLFASTYADHAIHPPNTLLENGEVKAPSRDHFAGTQRAVIEALKARGVI
jgi:predicted amidohydrolase